MLNTKKIKKNVYTRISENMGKLVSVYSLEDKFEKIKEEVIEFLENCKNDYIIMDASEHFKEKAINHISKIQEYIVKFFSVVFIDVVDCEIRFHIPDSDCLLAFNSVRFGDRYIHSFPIVNKMKDSIESNLFLKGIT